MIVPLPFGLGLIEGYYGRQWGDAERIDMVRFLAQTGYRYYFYAPKGDRYLRGQWREPWPDADERRMHAIANACAANDIAWGVGLSPLGLVEDLSSAGLLDLRRKIASLDRVSPDILCILFDDMPRNIEQLAAAQIRVVDEVLSVTRCRHVLVCPSYYSNDPVLERLFGTMPADYWDELGTGLPPQVGLFWTGERVCSSDYHCEELQRIANRFRRKPVLWDNYPVNDGAKTSNFLHVDAFRGRPAELADALQAHFVNPMNQSWLSRIPLASLGDLYREKERYDAARAFRARAIELAGEPVGTLIVEDVALFQHVGLNAMSVEQTALLRARYAGLTSPYAREIVAWLDGEYTFDPACLTD
jgi:hyaluronoglucosaminidase